MAVIYLYLDRKNDKFLKFLLSNCSYFEINAHPLDDRASSYVNNKLGLFAIMCLNTCK